MITDDGFEQGWTASQVILGRLKSNEFMSGQGGNLLPDSSIWSYRNTLGKYCGKASEASYAARPLGLAKSLLAREKEMCRYLKQVSETLGKENEWTGKEGLRNAWFSVLSDACSAEDPDSAVTLELCRESLLSLERNMFIGCGGTIENKFKLEGDTKTEENNKPEDNNNNQNPEENRKPEENHKPEDNNNKNPEEIKKPEENKKSEESNKPDEAQSKLEKLDVVQFSINYMENVKSDVECQHIWGFSLDARDAFVELVEGADNVGTLHACLEVFGRNFKTFSINRASKSDKKWYGTTD